MAELRPTVRLAHHLFLGMQAGLGATMLGVNVLDSRRTVERLFGAIVSCGLSLSARW